MCVYEGGGQRVRERQILKQTPRWALTPNMGRDARTLSQNQESEA